MRRPPANLSSCLSGTSRREIGLVREARASHPLRRRPTKTRRILLQKTVPETLRPLPRAGSPGGGSGSGGLKEKDSEGTPQDISEKDEDSGRTMVGERV